MCEPNNIKSLSLDEKIADSVVAYDDYLGIEHIDTALIIGDKKKHKNQ